MTASEPWTRVRRDPATLYEVSGHRAEGAGCLVGGAVMGGVLVLILANEAMPVWASVAGVVSAAVAVWYELERRRGNRVIARECAAGTVIEVAARRARLLHTRHKRAFQALLVDLGDGIVAVLPFPFDANLEQQATFPIFDSERDQAVAREAIELDDVVLLLREEIVIRFFEDSGRIASLRLRGGFRYLDREEPVDAPAALQALQGGEARIFTGLEADPEGEVRFGDDVEVWEVPEGGRETGIRGGELEPSRPPQSAAETRVSLDTDEQGVTRIEIRKGRFAAVYWYGNEVLMVSAGRDRALILANPLQGELPLTIHGEPARFEYGEAGLASDHIEISFDEASGDLLGYAVHGARLQVDESRMGPDLGRSGAAPGRSVTWLPDLDPSRDEWIDAVLDRMAQVFA